MADLLFYLFAFSLEEFHNNFLKQGFPPIKIVREALLGDDSPAL